MNTEEDDDNKISPSEGVTAINDLLVGFVGGEQLPNLEDASSLLDQLEKIAKSTGVEVPGLDTKLASLRDTTQKTAAQLENSDAALWAGDLDRSRRLQESFVPPNLFDLDVPIDSDEDEDEEDLFPSIDEVEDIYADLEAGKAGSLEALLQSGSDLNALSGSWERPAFLAALDAPGRSVQTLKRLVEAGADPLVVHSGIDTAMSWAMGYNHPDTVTVESEREIIAFLTAQGLDISAPVPHFETTLIRAIISAGPPTVAALLSEGAKAEGHAPKDFTPEFLAGANLVMLAAPKPDILRLLLNNGADASSKDLQGRVPIDFIADHVRRAQVRMTPDDPWTVAHAQALEQSYVMLQEHLAD